jgi:predicted MFS family arabinose efflux permease
VLRSPGLLPVIAVMLFIGGVFGSVEVGTIASTDLAGRPGAAGVILAGYALGSLLAGLAYGQTHPNSPLTRQFEVAVSVLALSTLLVPLAAGSFGWLGVAVFVSGATTAPSLITGFALSVAVVPANAVTQGLAWATSGLILGFAAASAATGAVVDAAGPRQAFLVTACCGVAAAVTVLASRRRLAVATA